MTKAELEKQLSELKAKAEKLEAENAELRKRTATRDAAADEVRNMYANYKNRCAIVKEWELLDYLNVEDVEGQKKIRDKLLQNYYGAMSLFCVLFEDNELMGRRCGDRRWSHWVNYDLVSPDEMAKRPEWLGAIERYEKAAQTVAESEKATQTKTGKEADAWQH